MAYWHGYFGIENVGLNEAQKQTLVDVIRKIGKSDTGVFPNLYMQVRIRLDTEAAIFEALFDEDDLTVAQFKIWLGNIFDVDPDTIESELTQTQYGPLAVFSRPADTPRLRVILFGGVGADWEDSRQAVIAYLSDNREDWEGE